VSQREPDIWQLQAQFDTSGLISALSSDDAGIRRRAAAALRALNAREAIPALKAAYAAENDPEARQMIIAALKTLSSTGDLPAGAVENAPDPDVQPPMVQRLIQQLKSSDPDKIVAAANQLGDIGDKLAVEPLVLLFNDARMSIQVRLAVAEALLKLESAPVEVALLANLRHSDWRIRRNGAAILGQLKAEWAIQPLARALRDNNKYVRRTARAALKYIGTPEARKALARDGHPRNRRQPMQPRTPDGEKKEVKRPQQPRADGLLRFIQEQEKKQDDEEARRKKAAQRSKRGTKPLDDSTDPDASPDAKNQTSNPHYEPTRPIGKNLLDELQRELDDDSPQRDASDTDTDTDR
jgi:HEAT repeat protein